MRFNLTKEEMHDHLKVKKAALISIAINVLEIVAGIVMLTLVRRMLLGGVEESIVRMVSLLCFTIVGWGALTDIGASLTSLRMVRRTQELERQKGILYGIALIILGIASSAMSGTVGGADVQDFISGILMGLSIVEILAGIWVIGKKLLNQ